MNVVIDRHTPGQRPNETPVMYQRWRSLLFLHWEFPADVLQPMLPKGLDLDTFDGKAYVGLVPFRMERVRPRWLPALPWLSKFPETNVRTYVHKQGANPGVWFFSLDAANPIAVILARTLFHLPYYYAQMTVHDNAKNGEIHYQSRRFWPSLVPAAKAIVCRTIGKPGPAVPGTLDHFLIERYFLYTTRRNELVRGQVHHTPYPIQSAELKSFDEALLATHTLVRPPVHPLIHFSGGVDVEIFSVRPAEVGSGEIR